MKKFFLAVVLVLSVNYAFSQDVVLKLRPLFGFSVSSVNELVYKNGVKESHLEWKNYKPSIGINVVCAIQNFIMDFKLQSAIPVALGNVTDKDFFTETNSISMYSWHDLITDKDYSFDFNLSYKFDLPVFIIGLGLSTIYSNIKMEATDGYLQYPVGNNVWTGNENKEYLNGTVISYEQSRFIAGFLLFLQKEYNYFAFTVTGCFYPVVRVECIDNHFLRAVQFLDYMKDGISYKIKSQVDWKINEKCCLFINADFIYLNAEGDTSINSLGIITYDTTELDETCSAATSYYDLVFTLGFEIKI